MFDNNQETEKEPNSTHEQLSLDFELTPEPVSNTDKEEAVAPDIPVQKEKKEKKEKEEKKPRKKKKHSAKNFQEECLPLGVGSFGKYLQDMRVKK